LEVPELADLNYLPFKCPQTKDNDYFKEEQRLPKGYKVKGVKVLDDACKQ